MSMPNITKVNIHHSESMPEKSNILVFFTKEQTQLSNIPFYKLIEQTGNFISVSDPNNADMRFGKYENKQSLMTLINIPNAVPSIHYEEFKNDDYQLMNEKKLDRLIVFVDQAQHSYPAWNDYHKFTNVANSVEVFFKCSSAEGKVATDKITFRFVKSIDGPFLKELTQLIKQNKDFDQLGKKHYSYAWIGVGILTFALLIFGLTRLKK